MPLAMISLARLAIQLVASVSAASALAVDLAETSGQTLVGFLRGENMTVYTGANRLI